jgi:hypothetical protein
MQPGYSFGTPCVTGSEKAEYLERIICPSKFKDFLLTVRSLAGNIEERGQYTVTSYALEIGHMLKKHTRIVKTDAICRKIEVPKKLPSFPLAV